MIVLVNKRIPQSGGLSTTEIPKTLRQQGGQTNSLRPLSFSTGWLT